MNTINITKHLFSSVCPNGHPCTVGEVGQSNKWLKYYLPTGRLVSIYLKVMCLFHSDLVWSADGEESVSRLPSRDRRP